MFTINLQPGAVVVNQDSRELPDVLARLTALEAVLEAMRVKLDTLVPDMDQVDALRERLKAQTDALAAVVDARSPINP